MITFINEVKSDSPNANKNNALQDGPEIRLSGNKAIDESSPSRISYASRMSALGAAGILQVDHSMNTSRLERRMCLERLSFSLQVSLVHNDQDIGFGMIRNVGGRGMFVETSLQIDTGTPIQLHFTLMGNGRVPSHQVVGRVAHVTDKGIGVHLDVLKRDTLTGLQALKKQAGREHRIKTQTQN